MGFARGVMLTSTHLLRRRRFLPLFVTQLFNAFNDNLYKTAMVLFVVYQVYDSADAEGMFSAVASGLFILPFFLLSALAGQLADMRDKAAIIRRVKFCEIGLMLIGASGLYLAWRGYDLPVSIPLGFTTIDTTFPIVLMLFALFLTGVHDPGGLDPGRMGCGIDHRDLAGRIRLGTTGAQRAAFGRDRAHRSAHPAILHRADPQDDARSPDLFRDPCDQLFLDDWSGALHPVPAARQERHFGEQGSG